MNAKQLTTALLLLIFAQHTQAQGGLLFYDEFVDNRNEWPIITSQDAVTSIRKGTYFLQHTRSIRALSVKKHIPIDVSRDYMIVAELVKYDLQKAPAFGILWGRSDGDNEYNFLISAKGNFKIIRIFKGRIQVIVEWLRSKHINPGTELNRLTIKKVGNTMHFYINHHQVAKTKELPFFSDLVGIKVYHNQKVGIKSFRVYQN